MNFWKSSKWPLTPPASPFDLNDDNSGDVFDEQLKTQVLAKFPPTTIVASDLDPCLDENVQFSSMLVEAGAQVQS